jgi:hypothetical protein
MLHQRLKVFDEYVQGTSAVYTSVTLCEVLGRYDRLAIEALVDNVGSAATTMIVAIEHSGDGRTFVQKNVGAEIGTAGASTTLTNVYFGADNGATPSLGFVRLRITMGGPTPQAHVRLFVSCRDRGTAARALDRGVVRSSLGQLAAIAHDDDLWRQERRALNMTEATHRAALIGGIPTRTPNIR